MLAVWGWQPKTSYPKVSLRWAKIEIARHWHALPARGVNVFSTHLTRSLISAAASFSFIVKLTV
jgi:hypothetical protein